MISEKLAFKTEDAKLVNKIISSELETTERVKITSKALKGKIIFELKAEDASAMRGAKASVERFMKTVQNAMKF